MGTRPAVGVVVALGLAMTAISAPVSVVAQDEVLSAEGETPDVRIEVRDLKRSTDGTTVTLRLRLVNESGEDFAPSCDMREPGVDDSCGVFSGAYLTDTPNQKKYLVVRDSQNLCICSGIETVADGKRVNLWATYPAPPADVASVTVIVPLFEPIDGVPITGK